MTVLLDSGAFLALERGDATASARVKRAQLRHERLRTHGGIIGQVWRGRGGRQAMLARWIGGVEIVGLDEHIGRRAGELLGVTGGRDVVDAALVALARDGDVILTSDPHDLIALAEAANVDVDIVPV